MAQQYLIDINMNDPLEAVIRKCNNNFRLISASQNKLAKNDLRVETDEIDADLSGLNQAISNESSARAQADNQLSGRIDSLSQQITTMVNNAVLSKFPVGSVYISVDSANPSTFIGGTWQRLSNAFLVAASSSGTQFPAGSTGEIKSQSGTDSAVPWLSVYIWKRTA